MINLIKHNQQDVYVIGDLHGNFELLEDYIRERDFISNCILIAAGDCGFGFKPLHAYLWEMENLNFALSQKNCILYMVRGNHDDPQYFNKQLINLSNVHTIEDYSVIEVGLYNILCVGGGISIDRLLRLSYDNERKKTIEELHLPTTFHPSYWDNEMPIFNEEKLNEIKDSGIMITHVVSHTSPSFCFKVGTKGIETWINADKNLLKDLSEERQIMTKLYDKLMEDKHPIMKWVFGHFHQHHEENINSIHFVTLHHIEKSLDICELTPQF